jgi:cobalamin synthase
MPVNANGLTEVVIIMPAVATLVGAIGAGIAMFGISYLKGNQYLIFQVVAFIFLALSFVTVTNVPDSTDMNILGLMHITAAMPIVGALTIMTPEQRA